MRARPLLALALALALLGLAPSVQSRAEAAIYWSSFSSLGRANLDGSMPLWPLPSGSFPALQPASPCGLAVDEQHIYWGDTTVGAIGRATVAGTAADTAFVNGLGAPCGVAVNATHVYWSDLDTNLIGRARLDGSGVEPAFVAGAQRPCGIAVDEAHVYWANQGGESIGRADLDGDDVDQEFVVGPGGPCGVAVTGTHLFWGDQEPGSIGRADLDGGSVELAWVSAAGEPWDVAANATHVFWADRWGTPADPNGGIGRAALDGSGVDHNLVPDLNNVTGVAVDARLLTAGPPAPLQPSDFLRFGPLKRNRRDGSLRLDVYVPGRGTFKVASPAIRWKLHGRTPPPFASGWFRWRLKLWPGGRTAASRRIHRQLDRDGRAPIVLRAVYRQEGREAISRTKRLAFTR